MNANVILTNPPYNKYLHEKFLTDFFDNADIICSVQPIGWLYGSRKPTKLIANINKYGANITSINPTIYFDAAFQTDLGIYYINKDKKIIYNNKKYNNALDINKFSNDEKLVKLKNIVNAKEVFSDHIRINELPILDEGYMFVLPFIRGHTTLDGPLDDYYTVISNADENTKKHIYYFNYKNIKDLNLSYQYIEFENIDSLYNCLNYMKTYFFRIFLYMAKYNLHVDNALKYIPWYDFNNNIFDNNPKIIDSILFKKYNISNDIINHIKNILPDYYNLENGRDNTIKSNSNIENDYATDLRKERRKANLKTNEFFTPTKLIKDMCDMIPYNIWTNPNSIFLEPCAGNGNFVLEIIQRRIKLGIPYLQVLKTTFSIELMEDNVNEQKIRILKLLDDMNIDYNKQTVINIINKNMVCSDYFNWDIKNWQSQTIKTNSLW